MFQWQVMVSLNAQKEKSSVNGNYYSSGLETKYNVPQGKKGFPVYSHYLMELFPITHPLNSLIHKLFFSKGNNASEKPHLGCVWKERIS